MQQAAASQDAKGQCTDSGKAGKQQLPQHVAKVIYGGQCKEKKEVAKKDVKQTLNSGRSRWTGACVKLK